MLQCDLGIGGAICLSVCLLLHVEYLRNDTIQTHSHYRPLTESVLQLSKYQSQHCPSDLTHSNYLIIFNMRTYNDKNI